MKIAVSSIGKNIDSTVSDIFGRCRYFIIVEIENKKITGTQTIENLNTKKAGSAGISAAQAVAEKGVSAVITGNVGPKALDVLNQFNIKIYIGAGTVKEAIQKFIDGKLKTIGDTNEDSNTNRRKGRIKGKDS